MADGANSTQIQIVILWPLLDSMGRAYIMMPPGIPLGATAQLNSNVSELRDTGHMQTYRMIHAQFQQKHVTLVSVTQTRQVS